jgi:hypothetical protein
MIYAGTESSKQLYISSVRQGIITPRPPIQNPTQQMLRDTAPDPDYWIDINDSQWRGNPNPPPWPMYYAVREDSSNIYIHYSFLYAGQHGQTVRALRSGTEFDAQLWTVGEHPGDLERFMIALQKETFSFVSAEFEAHGKPRRYIHTEEIKWKDETHAVVSVGLNNHSNWNELKEGNPVADEGGRIPGVVLIGNFLGGDKSRWWFPYADSSPFIQLGLDEHGQPINDQIWAAYCGDMGKSYATDLRGATYFDGRNLTTFDWDFVKIVWAGAKVLGKLKPDFERAGGPPGPGARDWVHSRKEAQDSGK